MPERMVIGLFAGFGTAEDARNRLRTEGFADIDIELRKLKATGPIPQTMAPESADFAVDLFFSTTVPREELDAIHNGETAVCVRTHSQDESKTAVDILHLYAPVDIRVLERSETDTVWRETQRGSLTRRH